MHISVTTPSGIVEQTFYVATTGSDTTGRGTEAQPWRTIQYAANRAQAGDTVLIQNGTYAPFNPVSSGTATHPITFRAHGDAVIIHPGNEIIYECIRFEGTNHIVIDGLTITNLNGYGIFNVLSRGVTIQNCVIRNCLADGILTAKAADIRILNNVLRDNNRHGIDIDVNDVYSDNTLSISGNQVYGNGGYGISVRSSCESGNGSNFVRGAIIEKNVIHDNYLTGLGIAGISESIICNNFIYHNGTEGGGPGGIFILGSEQEHCPGIGMLNSNNNLIVNNTVDEPRMAAVNILDGNVNNIVFNNICISNGLPIALGGIGNDVDSTSNLQRNTTGGIFSAPESGDYRLAENSPAKDAGRAEYSGHRAPFDDCDGAVRPRGGGYDIGAYEN